MLKMALKALIIVVLVVLGLYLLLASCQEKLVYFPQAELSMHPDVLGFDYVEVDLRADDGVRLHAWHIRTEGSSGTVLHCHGNAGNISHRLELALSWQKLGDDILLFDYRGFGRSEGRPDEEGTYLDARAAWRYLTVQRGIPPRDIVVHGKSLGGAVAAKLAREVNPAVLIVDSSFTSLDDIGAEVYPFLPVRLFSRFHYETQSYLKELRCPVLFIHSPDDKVIPYAHGRANFQAAREPKLFAKATGGHNDNHLDNRAVAKKVKEFLNTYREEPGRTSEMDS